MTHCPIFPLFLSQQRKNIMARGDFFFSRPPTSHFSRPRTEPTHHPLSFHYSSAIFTLLLRTDFLPRQTRPSYDFLCPEHHCFCGELFGMYCNLSGPLLLSLLSESELAVLSLSARLTFGDETLSLSSHSVLRVILGEEPLPPPHEM